MSAPARPPRPGTVTVAFWLQLTMVLILVALAAMAVAEAVHFDDEISRAARLVSDADPAEVAGERKSNVAITLIIAVPALLLAGWLAATAGPVRRGRNTARIMVFVASGAQLLVCFAQCCSGGLIVPTLFQPETVAEPGSDDVWQESRFYDTLYSNADPLDNLFVPAAGVTVLAVLIMTAALVLLLALPPAHRWFVPRAASTEGPPAPVALAWSPPSYPAIPAYPFVPPAHGTPGFLPPGQQLPPGHLICPDPAAHLTPAPPEAWAGESSTVVPGDASESSR
ncbi:hypothetical protein V6V47_05125 [Micromonospora sp. CPCC 205539]|uniref:hypothetical protein n=1 Tax=Micromonospora sp. CPCC 205539 TaxID=3122408 RepID=UPI002FEF0667